MPNLPADLPDAVDLPEDVLEEVIRLTREIYRGRDEDHQGRAGDWAKITRRRRDTMLEKHGYVARIRDDEDGPTLVCYPDSWLDGDGLVRVERVEDTEEAIEVSLAGGDEERDWEAVDSFNRDIVDAVRREYGNPHGETAAAFADFMGNHYLLRIDEATAAHVREFRSQYFPRNAWPSPEQTEALEDSLRYVFETAGEPFPPD
jgi:hypothetical protein